MIGVGAACMDRCTFTYTKDSAVYWQPRTGLWFSQELGLFDRGLYLMHSEWRNVGDAVASGRCTDGEEEEHSSLHNWAIELSHGPQGIGWTGDKLLIYRPHMQSFSCIEVLLFLSQTSTKMARLQPTQMMIILLSPPPTSPCSWIITASILAPRGSLNQHFK